MLFIMLAFSVLFDSVKAPGLGLGARYIFTMAIGRLLRAITFVSTILPSARPWCASARFRVPAYPHRWAQKYYVPYVSDANAIRQLIHLDRAFDEVANFIEDSRPDWGSMNFLIDFLRPNAFEGSSWYHLLKKAGGGCNDLLYSGHMLVAVLTAMAWTAAYGGFSSVLIWLLVMHSAQREVREHHHYSVDCVVAITGQVPRRIPFSPPDTNFCPPLFVSFYFNIIHPLFFYFNIKPSLHSFILLLLLCTNSDSNIPVLLHGFDKTL
ncbi:hypothetical protein CsSME_00039092 [Camellia sinensis var. sinensis]